MPDLLNLPPSELEALIRHHRKLYYAGTPEIPDAEFDLLVERLTDVCPESDVLSEVGAPVDGVEKRKHRIPMGSLEKKTPAVLEKTWAEMSKVQVIAQEKLDGISIDLEYIDGLMVAAITRGDGIEGEVVTHNSYWQNVLPHLPVPFSGALRGEIVCSKERFEETFVAMGFANPRNTVSGVVRRRDDPKHLNTHFEVRYFDIVKFDDLDFFASETQKMQYIAHTLQLKPVNGVYGIFPGDIHGLLEQYTKTRDALEFEADGLVVKIDSVELQRQYGVRQNRPRWAFAIKFPSQGAWTNLIDVDWQLGIGGRLTPVARLEPVAVGGVTVSNATLHHYQYIQDIGLASPAKVFVERAGDVIPQITKCQVPPAVLGAYMPPQTCPKCAAKTRREGKFYICPNMACSGKVYGDVYKWVKEVEIDALGDTWIRVLTESGLVKTPGDLYRLRKPQLLELERMGEVLAQKILDNIHKARNPSFEQYLAGLNIQGFSRTRAEALIAAGYKDIGDLVNVSRDKLEEIPGFGKTLAHVVCEGLRRKQEIIVDLGKAGVQHKPVSVTPTEGTLVGKSFCFTGSIQRVNPATKARWTRSQMQGFVKREGGIVKNSITSDLDYLVMADPNSQSAKAKKARSTGVTILSEDAFFDIVGAQ